MTTILLLVIFTNSQRDVYNITDTFLILFKFLCGITLQTALKALF